MGKLIKNVSVKISKSFFDNIFEPERKKLEKQIGTRVGQISFTEFLAKKKVKFIFPKQKNTFLPKEVRRKK